MKYIFLLLLICISTPVGADQVTAEQLLYNVIAQLPREPLNISGDLLVRKKRGVVVDEMKFDIALRLGERPSVATYTIHKPSDKSRERLVVTRKQGKQKPAYSFYSGDDLKPGKLPDLYKPVKGSDMSWMDITLSFLWWEKPKITGESEIRGRKCYIVEVTAPDGTGGVYSKARLWIDKKLHMLMQAEGVDDDGELKRKLWVKSFKKINELWMIKDMEIESYPRSHRTKLRIKTMTLEDKSEQ